VKASRRDLIAVGLVLALLLGQAVAWLHLGHSHDPSEPSSSCSACVLSHSPGVQLEQPLVLANVCATGHSVQEVPCVLVNSVWLVSSSPRSPPAGTEA